jgi:hypothetical protein
MEFFFFQMPMPLYLRARRVDELFDKYETILHSYGAPGYVMSCYTPVRTSVTVVVDLKDRNGTQVKYFKVFVTTDHDLQEFELALDDLVRFAKEDVVKFFNN